MKSRINSYPFSLKDISELLDLKLDYWSDRLKTEFNKKIDLATTGIIAEMDKRFAEVYDRFNEVDERFNKVEKRFDDNDDTHQEILGAMDEMCDRKLAKHCSEKHSFATS